MVTFMREMKDCSIFSMYEILNLSTKKKGSIYYTLCIIHYTTKKLNKFLLLLGKKFFGLNQMFRTRDNEKVKTNRL